MNQVHKRYEYWSWKNFFSKEEIKNLEDTFNTHPSKDAKDVPAQNATKKVRHSFSCYGNFRNSLQDLHQRILNVNRNYFGYTLWEQSDYDIVFLNEYHSTDKGEYDWHKDGSNNFIYDYKFTVLINCSTQPYTGGDFYLMDNGGSYTPDNFKNPGDVIIFKSNTLHKVTPVTKGIRKTMAFFYYGAKQN